LRGSRPPLKIARDQLDRFLREVKQDRRSFGDDETRVVDHRHLMEAADPAIGLSRQLAIGMIGGRDRGARSLSAPTPPPDRASPITCRWTRPKP